MTRVRTLVAGLVMALLVLTQVQPTVFSVWQKLEIPQVEAAAGPHNLRTATLTLNRFRVRSMDQSAGRYPGQPGATKDSCHFIKKYPTIGSCGDAVRQLNEACDDGNTVAGDDCSADCKTVTGDRSQPF